MTGRPARERVPIADIKAELQAHIERLAPMLAPAPDAYRSGCYWITRNPARSDRHAGSFVVWLKGGATGCWKDYATGEKGDVLDLVQHCLRLPGRGEAVREALSITGLERLSAVELERQREKWRQLEKERSIRHERDLVRARRRAFGFWAREARPLEAGSVAWTYLTEARGIPLATFPHLPSLVRWVPSLRHTDMETGEITEWPALVSGIVDAGGKVIAIHRTWLAADGSGKAPVDPPRKAWPDYAGGVIWLSRGVSGLSVAEARRAGHLDVVAIGEGVEDGLSLAALEPTVRVCAGISLSNLQNIPDFPFASAWLLSRDNDWGKPQAADAFETARLHFVATGKPVEVVGSPVGKDFNDAMKG